MDKSYCNAKNCEQMAIDNIYCIDHKCTLCSSQKYDYMLYCSEHICCNQTCLNHGIVNFDCNDLNYITSQILDSKFNNMQYFQINNNIIIINENIISTKCKNIEELIKTYDILKSLKYYYLTSYKNYCIECFIVDIKYILTR